MVLTRAVAQPRHWAAVPAVWLISLSFVLISLKSQCQLLYSADHVLPEHDGANSVGTKHLCPLVNLLEERVLQQPLKQVTDSTCRIYAKQIVHCKLSGCHMLCCSIVVSTCHILCCGMHQQLCTAQQKVCATKTRLLTFFLATSLSSSGSLPSGSPELLPGAYTDSGKVGDHKLCTGQSA